MEREWPLVGRVPELERVDQLLRRGGGSVVLAGPPGVGKTRLARECLERAILRGFNPVRVGGTQASAAIPFGAFALLLPDPTAGADHSEVLREMAHAIVQRFQGGQGRRVALLVDDAHLLDEGSAALTRLLAVDKGVFVLATVRSGSPVPDAVAALWNEGLAERLEVRPLSAGGVDELLAAALGGPVDRGAVHQLWRRTRGNPLFLKELVIAGLEAGALRSEEGLWQVQGKLPASDRLVELVQLRLVGLTEADRNALEVLALGERLGAGLLRAVEARSDLDALERCGLAHIEQDGRRLQVRLANPVYGEVLRARISPLRSRLMTRALAGALEATGGRRRDDLLRLATWRLDGGGRVQAERMLTAATTARWQHDLPLAERLVGVALDAGAGFDAAVLAAQLASLQGRSAEAENRLATLASQATDDPQRGVVAIARMDNLMYQMGRAEDALSVGAAAEAAAECAWRDEIAAKRAGILYSAVGPRAAGELAEPLRHRAEGRALAWAGLMAALAHSRMGRLSTAEEAAAQTQAALSAAGSIVQWHPCHFAAVRCEILAYAGRLTEAHAFASDHHARALADGSDEARAIFAWQLAKILLARGQVETAARFGREGVALFRQMRRVEFARQCLVVLATALALHGRTEKATRALEELDALGLPPSRIPAVDHLQARAWTAVASDPPRARALLEEAANVGTKIGDHVGRAEALHGLARLALAREVAGPLAETSALIEGSLAPARVAHTSALARGDAAALQAVSVVFEEMPAVLLAAEAAADAAVAWRRAKEPRKAAAAQRRACALAARCEGARTPALTAVGARAALSALELEIARLAATGVANKQIAARLSLSVRTVENKLHAAYQKMGVDSRTDLAETLAQHC